MRLQWTSCEELDLGWYPSGKVGCREILHPRGGIDEAFEMSATTCREKSFSQRKEVHFIDGKPVIFDTQSSRLIGFTESIIAGDRLLFRGENSGLYFLLECDPIGLEPARIHPLSEDAAVRAWGRVAVKAGLFRSFPNIPRPKKA